MNTVISYVLFLVFLLVMLVALTAAFHFYTQASVSMLAGTIAWYATGRFLDWMHP